MTSDSNLDHRIIQSQVHWLVSDLECLEGIRRKMTPDCPDLARELMCRLQMIRATCERLQDHLDAASEEFEREMDDMYRADFASHEEREAA